MLARNERFAQIAYDALVEDPSLGFDLALALLAPEPARGRPLARAGVPCEVEPSRIEGPPSLAPAPGSIPGLDEGRENVTLYRTLFPSRLSGKAIAAGTRVIVSRRFPSAGDLAVVATRRAIRIVATGPAGAVPLPPDGRFIGTVEAVVP